jgi:CO/xanthine dehydrogenase Mo-binding subunit
MTAGLLPGPYRVPAYRVTGRVRLTNKTPAATYRAPGRYEGTFVRERLLDAIAAKLGIDPLEVRRRNLITSNEMPYQRPLDAIGDEIVYDSGDYAGPVDKALAAVGWDGLQAGLRRRRTAGEAVGAGLAIFVEKSGLGPTDRVTISVDNQGTVEVVTGGASVGQGFETVMAQGEGAGGRGRVDAIARRGPRPGRRQSGRPGPAGRTLNGPRRDRPKHSGRARRRGPAYDGTHELPLWGACRRR